MKNNLMTDAYIIGICQFNTLTGKTLVEQYTALLSAHLRKIKQLSKATFKASERALRHPTNYQGQPQDKALEKVFALINAEEEPYKKLDVLGQLIEAKTPPLPGLCYDLKREVGDLVSLEQLFKPSIEFSTSILAHLKNSQR